MFVCACSYNPLILGVGVNVGCLDDGYGCIIVPDDTERLPGNTRIPAIVLREAGMIWKGNGWLKSDGTPIGEHHHYRLHQEEVEG